jgi:hypothetical protein
MTQGSNLPKSLYPSGHLTRGTSEEGIRYNRTRSQITKPQENNEKKIQDVWGAADFKVEIETKRQTAADP